jgi:hypothetical protein
MSFVIVVGIVILNVVVAVLLDEFVESVSKVAAPSIHDSEPRFEDCLTLAAARCPAPGLRFGVFWIQDRDERVEQRLREQQKHRARCGTHYQTRRRGVK